MSRRERPELEAGVFPPDQRPPEVKAWLEQRQEGIRRGQIQSVFKGSVGGLRAALETDQPVESDEDTWFFLIPGPEQPSTTGAYRIDALALDDAIFRSFWAGSPDEYQNALVAGTVPPVPVGETPRPCLGFLTAREGWRLYLWAEPVPLGGKYVAYRYWSQRVP